MMKNLGPSPKNLTLYIKNEVLASGFSSCGVATLERLNETEPRLKNWLDKGFNGSMEYMGRNLDKRLDPTILLPGAKSIVVAALNYFPAEKQNPKSRFLVSKYAYGDDYHQIVKDRLHLVAAKMKSFNPNFRFRVFADSAPVMEREWAARSGIGGIGKNGCVIIPKKGSFFFLGEIISNLELEPDKPFSKNLCGTCSKCIESCPTEAIVSPGVVDARKCISYLTIESKAAIPYSLRNKTLPWIFGCDTCQDVCPHNRFSTPTAEMGFATKARLKEFDDALWLSLDETTFKEAFPQKKSPIARVGFEKFKDNIFSVHTALSNQLAT